MANKSQVFGVTRSQLMTRAWQLTRLNRRTATSSLKNNFGRWLALAWAEAREGELQFWPMNVNPHASLQHEIDCLNGKDRWTPSDYRMADMLSAAMRALSH